MPISSMTRMLPEMNDAAIARTGETAHSPTSPEGVERAAIASAPSHATWQAHRDGFAALAEDRNAEGPVAGLRRQAFARFDAAGFPARKIESWKFTSLRPLETTRFSPALPVAGSASTPARVALVNAITPSDCHARLVFEGGQLAHDLCILPENSDCYIESLAKNMKNGSLPPTLAEDAEAEPDQALIELNTAFMTDGAVLTLREGARIAGPILLVHLAGDAPNPALHTRHLVTLEEGAKACLIELFLDEAGAPALTNAVTDIRIGKGASLVHGRLQEEGSKTVHCSQARVTLGARGRYHAYALALGALLSRQETSLTFTAPGGEARLYGGAIGRGRQHLDHTTRVDHAHPECVTDELFRSVLDDRAHGVFQGLVRVAPHAIRTDARQKSQALLLSDRAVADCKPELEILADDVKCAHGASIGELDAEQLFYLRSRGIDKATASEMLVEAFLAETLERITHPALSTALQGALSRAKTALHASHDTDHQAPRP